MAQTREAIMAGRRYTRVDFAALRFKLNKMPDEYILSRVYDEHALKIRGINTAYQLGLWLDDLRDNLIERARQNNPLVAGSLERARSFNSWPPAALNFIIQSGEQDKSKPTPEDPIGVWMKPVVSRILKAEGIQTLAALAQYIQARGENWYRGLPRIGKWKANSIVSWYRNHEETLGKLDVRAEPESRGGITLDPVRNPLVPLEHIAAIVNRLDGSQGNNRAQGFCLIRASNDLDAVQAYLYKYRNQKQTHRAYQKELERFLLWCVSFKGIPMSSVMMQECEEYKDFLKNPDQAWTGSRTAKASPRWRPFQGPLSPSSQKYAVQTIRGFFEWLVRVRYLGGNPWITVSDPRVEIKETLIDIDRALPSVLWKKIAEKDGILDRACAKWPEREWGDDPKGTPLSPKSPQVTGVQCRLAKAIFLLLGYSGLRREEAATAIRKNLHIVPESVSMKEPIWELSVLGKRSKWRKVYLPQRAVDTLIEHWHDRGHDFQDERNMGMALLSPVVLPQTKRSQEKQTNEDGLLNGRGVDAAAIYNVLKAAIKWIGTDGKLTNEERRLVQNLSPHDLRHTYATDAAAAGMPVDVLQRVLGHVSQQTTSIYVQAERNRTIEEVINYLDKK